MVPEKAGNGRGGEGQVVVGAGVGNQQADT